MLHGCQLPSSHGVLQLSLLLRGLPRWSFTEGKLKNKIREPVLGLEYYVKIGRNTDFVSGSCDTRLGSDEKQLRESGFPTFLIPQGARSWWSSVKGDIDAKVNASGGWWSCGRRGSCGYLQLERNRLCVYSQGFQIGVSFWQPGRIEGISNCFNVCTPLWSRGIDDHSWTSCSSRGL